MSLHTMWHHTCISCTCICFLWQYLHLCNNSWPDVDSHFRLNTYPDFLSPSDPQDASTYQISCSWKAVFFLNSHLQFIILGQMFYRSKYSPDLGSHLYVITYSVVVNLILSFNGRAMHSCTQVPMQLIVWSRCHWVSQIERYPRML